MKIHNIILAATTGAVICAALAGAQSMAGTSGSAMMVTPETAHWGPPPMALVSGPPPSAFLKEPPFAIAVINGNPTKPGAPYTIWFRCKKGTRIAPHWHPGDENLLIIRGSFRVTEGDVWSTSGMVLNSGSWTIVPKTHHHYATCVKDSVVAVYGIGPFKLNWLTMK